MTTNTYWGVRRVSDKAEFTLVLHREQRAAAFAAAILYEDTGEEHEAAPISIVPAECRWTWNSDEERWDAECGDSFWLLPDEHSPGSWGMKHCPYCGGAIVEGEPDGRTLVYSLGGPCWAVEGDADE